MQVFLVKLFITALFAQSAYANCENDEWSKTCPNSMHLEDMSRYKKAILDAHNSKRNELAGGRMRRLKPAARMFTLEWDDELAQKAARNVRECILHTDACHSTDKFPLAGQNSGITYGTIWPASHFLHIIKQWWLGYEYVTDAVLQSYPVLNSAPFSNFTIMAKDRSTNIGCAAVIFSKSFFTNSYLLTCNYAIGNIVGEKTYLEGESASGCKTGRNKDYLNLCNLKEAQHE